jgi:pyrroloquinoline-quinone synthase
VSAPEARAGEAPLAPDAFEAALRRIGDESYHHRHPFNLRMHEGGLSREEIRTWVRNRYYYQTRIPVKDGLILTKSPDAGFRREWIQRIHDHDGQREGEGGLALWLALAEAVGLERAQVEGLGEVLPGVRRACDDYVGFVASHDLLESVAASLTELFAGDIMKVRIEAFERHYPWVDAEGLRYFRSRTRQAPRDAAFGLAFVRERARSAEDQHRCLRALERKCEILWRLLDAIERACAAPALVAHARLRDEGMVVLPERAVEIGGSGPEVLALCDGRRSSSEIARIMASRYAESERARDDVHDFLERMAASGALRFSRAR